jgi:hypothetical protein
MVRPSDEELLARARLSDEDILDRFQKRERMLWRMLWGLLGGLALLFTATAAAIFSGHGALVTDMRGRTVIAAFLGALFVYVFATIGRYAFQRSGIERPEADSPRLLHGRLDIYQRRWRRLVLLYVLTNSVAVMVLPRALPLLRAAHQWPLSMGIGAAFAGSMLLSAFILSAGPRWESMAFGAPEIPSDEFDSALRARAMRFGYRLLMLLLCSALLVALWQPDLSLTALTWALYAGFAVPALYYLIGDRRASRGDDG